MRWLRGRRVAWPVRGTQHRPQTPGGQPLTRGHGAGWTAGSRRARRPSHLLWAAAPDFPGAWPASLSRPGTYGHAVPAEAPAGAEPGQSWRKTERGSHLPAPLLGGGRAAPTALPDSTLGQVSGEALCRSPADPRPSSGTGGEGPPRS